MDKLFTEQELLDLKFSIDEKYNGYISYCMIHNHKCYIYDVRYNHNGEITSQYISHNFKKLTKDEFLKIIK